MNPIVEAAVVGVTGTVIVGVAGFGAAIWTTRKTLSAARRWLPPGPVDLRLDVHD